MIKGLTEAVNGVTQLDALMMTAAGNNGTPVTTYPQKTGANEQQGGRHRSRAFGGQRLALSEHRQSG